MLFLKKPRASTNKSGYFVFPELFCYPDPHPPFIGGHREEVLTKNLPPCPLPLALFVISLP
jgi:hypothetical protein